jgi:spore germination protein YaaH
MPRKDVWLSDEQLKKIKAKLGIAENEQCKGISEWIRQAVQEKLVREEEFQRLKEGKE